MHLHKIIPPELIITGLKAENKDEVFNELVDTFCGKNKIFDREDILEALWIRESKMSTGIIKGIAIPHVKITALDGIHAVIGISRKGIEYDSLDGLPVYLVFMILGPQINPEEYLSLLMSLSELLKNPDFYRDMLACNDSLSVVETIKKYEAANP